MWIGTGGTGSGSEKPTVEAVHVVDRRALLVELARLRGGADEAVEVV